MANLANNYVRAYNAKGDKDTVYWANAVVDINHEEMYWTGTVRESPDYVKCTVIYEIYKYSR
jgi:transcriptional regulator with GAF, ATPase, and Fis domain